MLSKNNKSQVWVETVIYTLIGLSVIAIILAVALPQIEKSKDRSIIEQTVVALNTLDGKISEVEQSPGSVRVIDFSIAKGKLEINAVNESIMYTLEDTRLELSQIGEEIKLGRIVLKTEKMPARYRITLTMSYSNLDITNKYGENLKVLQGGAAPYKVGIENKETSNPSENTKIEFSII